MSWEDDYLKWDPEDYGGVDRMQLPPSKIWTPDIFLFNDVTGHFGDDLKKDNPFLVVEHTGHVRWIPPLVLKYVLHDLCSTYYLLSGPCVI